MAVAKVVIVGVGNVSVPEAVVENEIAPRSRVMEENCIVDVLDVSMVCSDLLL